MNNQDNRKAVKLAITAVVLMSIIGALGGIIPFSGILIYFISILFFIAAKRRGFIFTLPFLIAAYVFVAFGTGFSAAIADILGPGLTALMMGELTRINRNQTEVIGKGILIGVLCNSASLISLKLVENKSVLDEMRKNMELIINSAANSKQMSVYDVNTLKQMYEGLIQIVPAMLIVIVIFGSIFIYFSGCAIMRKKGEEIPKFLPFKKFSFPNSVILGSIVVLLAGYIAGMTGIVSTKVLMINLCIIICFIFALQGLAVSLYFIDISSFPKVILIVLICMMFLSMIGTVVLFFIGLLDIIINIRGRIEAKRG